VRLAYKLSVAESVESCYYCDPLGALGCWTSWVGPIQECPGYRLPTEAEWEYLARGGAQGEPFPGGGGLDEGDENDCFSIIALDDGTSLTDLGWYCGNSSGATQVVRGKQPNGYGLYDMTGNVWEICHDTYAEQLEDATDPDIDGSTTIYRGGAHDSEPWQLRSANRATDGEPAGVGSVGMRLVRTAF
jgi:formylglycine-generating enzyme required for sulfatase activity